MVDAEFASTPGTRRRMQAMASGRDTAPELALRRELSRRGRRGYRIDRDLGLPGVRRRADIAWVGLRIAVFVDGCFWHCCPMHGTAPAMNANYWTPKLARNVDRDRETDRIAAESGWTVIRIWEHEHPFAAANRVEEVLTARDCRHLAGTLPP
jgi:DNA mismatch endonuclease, patch repair protein